MHSSVDNLPFDKIYAIDFEFFGQDGENPNVVCMVIQDLRSGRIERYWRDELIAMLVPPFDTGETTLLVSYFAPAELQCMITLDWCTEVSLVDLYAEFRCMTNGDADVTRRSLISALAHFGLEDLIPNAKDETRDLILTGGPWTKVQQKSILDYCGSTGSVTSTGTDPYLDPANVYSGYGFISTDLLVGYTDDDDLEHIVVNGQDYIIMSGSQAVEIWAMDGTTGELTKTQTLPLPETSDQGRSGIDLVNMTNDAGETNTYMYVQSLDFVNVFALDSASGQWNTVNGYLTSDMPIDGPGSGYSEVLSMPDGTTYLYTASGYQSERTNAIYRFELDPTTNTVLAEPNMGSRPTYAVDDNITAGGGNDSVTACWSIHPSASA